MPEKVLILGNAWDYGPHASFGEYSTDPNDLSKAKEVCLVVFTGGQDVDPFLYRHKPNPKTFYHPRRDVQETGIFIEARKQGVPCVGICRGGQFLNVMAGGFLYQHVNGHTRSHSMKLSDEEFAQSTVDENVFVVTSSHHQMFGLPEKSQLLGWSLASLSGWYELEKPIFDKKDHPILEPEVAKHPHINSLSVQFHPEWANEEETAYKYYVDAIKRHLKFKTRIKYFTGSIHA